MARTDTLGHFLTDVADAIRSKTGSSDTIQASDFDTEIENISGGDGYTITVNVIGGTASGATTTFEDNDAYIYVTPDEGKFLTENYITVVGASFAYSNNIIRLYNPTANITITAECISYGAISCIIATGTQYIVTDYVPNRNTRIEMEMDKPSWHEQWDVMWGSENRFTLMQYGWQATNTQLQLEMFSSSQPTGIDIQFNSRVKVILDASIPLFKYGEYTYTPYFGGNAPTGVMVIFAKRQNGSTRIDHYSNYKLYYFKIYEGDVLVRNYMPALDSNNIPCLYDTVNNTYLYNAGSGTFGYET